MKNIHVLPTEKPSRLMIDTIENKLYLQPILHEKTINVLTQNIYITSDEEIEKDYVIAYGVVIKVMMFDKETLYFVNGTKAKREECKKIILTTDQALIKDGIQAIDDEFLEWFVNNPSCESVNVRPFKNFDGEDEVEPIYKIIIPKEEPKQETLEEAIKQELENHFFSNISEIKQAEYFINFGAKWQQEQDKNKYSEEDVRGMLEDMSRYVSTKEMRVGLLFGYSEWVRKRDWFVNHLIEQFKNK